VFAEQMNQSVVCAEQVDWSAECAEQVDWCAFYGEQVDRSPALLMYIYSISELLTFPASRTKH
jgi:hypothetical protein